MFSSRSERGFYDAAIHTVMPTDVVEISAGYHVELLAGQSAGKVIEWGDDGYPVLVEPQQPGPDELAAVARDWRDRQLTLTDPLVSRHRDEIEEGGPTSITAEQYAELQAYRRQLRDWPEGGQFPLDDHRPIAPLWMTGPLQ
ncbi:tail fiber assembly protein [Pseudomonas sp. GM80]|uniref:tail fiber assembly protein n=1 Tax=Pseudomonas sp. GM80 TaxID=1144339 RepID=UPI00026F8CF0|nr:tail fiber assembly protein [Pseudomonas sp. GM80]EJN18667.1 Caudovirales tail fiber assembly protein [Pseudomonas sp. GM80]